MHGKKSATFLFVIARTFCSYHVCILYLYRISVLFFILKLSWKKNITHLWEYEACSIRNNHYFLSAYFIAQKFAFIFQCYFNVSEIRVYFFIHFFPAVQWRQHAISGGNTCPKEILSKKIISRTAWTTSTWMFGYEEPRNSRCIKMSRVHFSVFPLYWCSCLAWLSI